MADAIALARSSKKSALSDEPYGLSTQFLAPLIDSLYLLLQHRALMSCL